MKRFTISVLVVFVLFATSAFSGQQNLDFSWNQKISSDFAGWKIYKSNAPNVAVSAANVFMTVFYTGSAQTEYKANKELIVSDGQESIYYFVITAFDKNGNESDKSNEVGITVDFQPPDAPYTLRVVIKAE